MEHEFYRNGWEGQMYGDYVRVPDGVELPDKSVMHEVIQRAIELVIAVKPDRFEGLEVIMHDLDKEGTSPSMQGQGKTVGFKARFIKD